METNKDCCILLFLTVAAISFSHGDARALRLSSKVHNKDHHPEASIIKHVKRLKMMDLLLNQLADTANTQPYVGSPFNLPPYDSLPPMPFPENAPPFCPFPQNVPSTTLPSPTGFEMLSPPFYHLSPLLPSPPDGVPSSTGGAGVQTPIGVGSTPPNSIPSPTDGAGVLTPIGVWPTPPNSMPSPIGGAGGLTPIGVAPAPPDLVPSPFTYNPSPSSFELTPPGFTPTPPYDRPSPPTFEPSPPIFLPPIVYPPPTVPPPPHRAPSTNVWCVAKPSVPDPIIQEAMNYACESGGACDSIQPNGACFAPDTVIAHASFALNSFWQRTKVAGGTCEFGGTAMLVTMDPSYDGCHFDYY